MTNIVTLPRPRAGVTVLTPAQSPIVPTFPQHEAIARHQAIENALSMALYHLRHGDNIEAIRCATAKATRAASLLKHACEIAATHTVGV